MKNKTTQILSLCTLAALVFNLHGYNIFSLPQFVFLSVFLSLAVILMTVFFLRDGKISLKTNKWVMGLLILWAISLVVSTVFSVAPEMSFWGSYDRMQGLYAWIIYLGFFMFFLNLLDTKSRQETFMKVLMGVAAVVSIHGIVQVLGFDIFSTFSTEKMEFTGRAFATLGQPNFLGQFLIFPIWAGVYFFMTQKKKALPAVSTILSVITLLLTQNRASILGVVVGVIFLIIYRVKIKRLYKLAITGSVLILTTFFAAAVAPTIRSLLTRLYLWEGSFKLFPDHPIIGSGLETFEIVFQKVAPPALNTLESTSQIADHAHNEILDVLVMQGAFGFLLYAAIIIAILYTFSKKRQNKKNLLSSILVTAFISILTSNFFGFQQSIHYIITAAIIAMISHHILKFREIKVRRSIALSIFAIVLAIVAVINIAISSSIFVADIKYKSGLNHINNGEIQEGVIAMTKATEKNPHQAELYWRLSETIITIGKAMGEESLIREAEIILEPAGVFRNYDFRYYYTKTKIYALLGLEEQAQKYYSQLIEIAPNNQKVMEDLVPYLMQQ